MKTPETSFGYMILLNSTFPKLKLKNASLKNDLYDSAMSEDETIHIYFPNTFDPYKVLEHNEATHFTVNLRMSKKDVWGNINKKFTLNELLYMFSKWGNVYEFEETKYSVKEIIWSDGDSWDDIIVPELQMMVGETINVGANLDVTRIR